MSHLHLRCRNSSIGDCSTVPTIVYQACAYELYSAKMIFDWFQFPWTNYSPIPMICDFGFCMKNSEKIRKLWSKVKWINWFVFILLPLLFIRSRITARFDTWRRWACINIHFFHHRITAANSRWICFGCWKPWVSFDPATLAWWRCYVDWKEGKKLFDLLWIYEHCR